MTGLLFFGSSFIFIYFETNFYPGNGEGEGGAGGRGGGRLGLRLKSKFWVTTAFFPVSCPWPQRFFLFVRFLNYYL